MPVPLPAWHFASPWPASETHRPASQITELGTRYILASGHEKEQLALEIVRCFHTYLFKYLDMIVRGHLPTYTGGRVNEDAKKLLVYLMPRGEAVSKASLAHA